MDRREMLASFTGLAGSCAVVKEIPAEPKPLAFVLTVPESLSRDQMEGIETAWQRLWEGSPPGKLIVLPDGMDLKAITDSRV